MKSISCDAARTNIIVAVVIVILSWAFASCVTEVFVTTTPEPPLVATNTPSPDLATAMDATSTETRTQPPTVIPTPTVTATSAASGVTREIFMREPSPTALPTATPTFVQPPTVTATSAVFSPEAIKAAGMPIPRQRHGPESGDLLIFEGTISTRYAGLQVSDMVADANFHNRYGKWSYGFTFRYDGTTAHAVFVSSNGSWHHCILNPSWSDCIELGHHASIKTSGPERNHIRVEAVGADGKLYVNGIHVADLDLSAHLQMGDVGVACCFVIGDGHTGLRQKFEEFTVKPANMLAPTPTSSPITIPTSTPTITPLPTATNTPTAGPTVTNTPTSASKPTNSIPLDQIAGAFAEVYSDGDIVRDADHAILCRVVVETPNHPKLGALAELIESYPEGYLPGVFDELRMNFRWFDFSRIQLWCGAMAQNIDERVLSRAWHLIQQRHGEVATEEIFGSKWPNVATSLTEFAAQVSTLELDDLSPLSKPYEFGDFERDVTTWARCVEFIDRRTEDDLDSAATEVKQFLQHYYPKDDWWREPPSLRDKADYVGGWCLALKGIIEKRTVASLAGKPLSWD